ncbi:MAG: hypothetical protein M3N46_08910 [Actinomycetota bacterium]|nr:hypothetical protein [Actinomycetota bacterium]
MPADFMDYLRSQSRFGVHLSDVVEVKAGPYSTTLFTMTTSRGWDGSFGCPEPSQDPGVDCFGAQPDYALRMAVLDVRGTQLLVWLRDAADTKALKADSADFTAMVAGLRFPARAVKADAPASASATASPSSSVMAPTVAATPLDGTWRVTITRDELKSSPLLLDSGELNRDNFGTLQLIFDRGAEGLHNKPADLSAPDRFLVQGDVLTIETHEGERFVLRWRISGNHLILTRDAKHPISPTPLVLKPWTRAHP